MKFTTFLLVSIGNLVALCFFCYLYFRIVGKLHRKVSDVDITQFDHNQGISMRIRNWTTNNTFENIYWNNKCSDMLWCSTKMPKQSYFKFPPPTDLVKWQSAQIQAQNGEQILLGRILKTFPNYLDFLDGNIDFRKLNKVADVFIDQKRDLTPLTMIKTKRRLMTDFKWEENGALSVIPLPYKMDTLRRAPVVKLGYNAFSREGQVGFFEGPLVGDANMHWEQFFDHWKKVKDRIETPFIALHSFNENWGLLSTYFPNRTVDWGSQQFAMGSPERNQLSEFLDHNKTLLLMVGQHSNITHPKLVTLPRGLPIGHAHLARTLWDTMHFLSKRNKTALVFTASSNWGHRPLIVACVGRKFNSSDGFQRLTYRDDHHGRVDEGEYYRRLGGARTGLALPGLGADTFRLWEALTMGTVPVVEKGFGLEKTLWRLPALLVEDFDQVTPELLRTAYVEALYRADDFEFERLTQSFWWSFIANVSVTMSSQTVLDKFPLQAEDPDFARPFVLFDCWKTNSCGAGTKRVPKSSC